LGIYFCNKKPIGIGTAAMSGTVTVIAGVHTVAIRLSGGVICMKNGVLSTFVSLRKIGIIVTPMIIKITGNKIAVHHDLCCCGVAFGKWGDMILAIQCIGCIKTGWPLLYIVQSFRLDCFPGFTEVYMVGQFLLGR
jgi:hypothetical protein